MPDLNLPEPQQLVRRSNVVAERAGLSEVDAARAVWEVCILVSSLVTPGMRKRDEPTNEIEAWTHGLLIESEKYLPDPEPH